MEKRNGNRQFKGVVKLTSQKEMVIIILAVQIGNENVQINNSTSKKKFQGRTKWITNYLFSSLRSSSSENFFIFHPQPDRSIWLPKGISHCVKSAQIRSFFWSVFSCIWTEFREVRTRKNSVFGLFSRSVKL